MSSIIIQRSFWEKKKKTKVILGKKNPIFCLEFRGKILKALIRLYRSLMLIYALPCPVMKYL